MSERTEQLKEAIDKFDDGNVKEASEIIDSIMTEEIRDRLFEKASKKQKNEDDEHDDESHEDSDEDSDEDSEDDETLNERNKKKKSY